jgi:hypothetical protein
MNNKNNNTKSLMKAVMAMLIVTSVGSVSASTLKLDTTGIDVKSAPILPATVGTSVTYNLGAKFGYFASGFTATSLNLDQWDENFISMNGRWTASNKTFGISLSAGDLNVGSGSQYGSTAYGVAIPSTTQLLLLVSNVAYSSTPNTSSVANADYLLPAASVAAKTIQYAMLTDSSWKMIATTASGLGTTTVGFTANTAIYGGFGSYDSATSAITLIPEPSSASLLALGLAGLVALRIRRKS